MKRLFSKIRFIKFHQKEIQRFLRYPDLISWYENCIYKIYPHLLDLEKYTNLATWNPSHQLPNTIWYRVQQNTRIPKYHSRSITAYKKVVINFSLDLLDSIQSHASDLQTRINLRPPHLSHTKEVTLYVSSLNDVTISLLRTQFRALNSLISQNSLFDVKTKIIN